MFPKFPATEFALIRVLTFLLPAAHVYPTWGQVPPPLGGYHWMGGWVEGGVGEWMDEWIFDANFIQQVGVILHRNKV